MIAALFWVGVVARPAAAFAVVSKTKKGVSSTVDGSTIGGTTTTALNNGMDAYDAQMRAMASGQPASIGQQAITPTPKEDQTDNFKSSQRWRKKTKQLATLGPASSSFEMIEKLFLAGADVFRLNFSHGEHAQKKELLDTIRQVEQKYDHPIAILGDLQGPKLRVGQFANPDGELLQKGQMFRFDLDASMGTNQRVQLPHPEIIEASQVGHVLLIDDGKVKLQVTGTGPGYLDCTVEVAGRIKDKKVRNCFVSHRTDQACVQMYSILLQFVITTNMLFFLVVYRA